MRRRLLIFVLALCLCSGFVVTADAIQYDVTLSQGASTVTLCNVVFEENVELYVPTAYGGSDTELRTIHLYHMSDKSRVEVAYSSAPDDEDEHTEGDGAVIASYEYSSYAAASGSALTDWQKLGEGVLLDTTDGESGLPPYSDVIDFSGWLPITTVWRFDFYFHDLTSVSLYFMVDDAEHAFTEVPDPTAAQIAYPSTQTVLIDGKPVEFQMYALMDENDNPTNYIKVRDLAYVLNGSKAQFGVVWDGTAINLTPGVPYAANGTERMTLYSGAQPYTIPTTATYVRGKPSELKAIALMDGGFTYYRLRDLGAALGFNVSWSSETGVYIETDKPYDDN